QQQAASKVLDHLKTSESQVITDPGEVCKHAVAFYHDLFATEPSCPEATRELHAGLLRLGALESGELEKELSLEKLAAAADGLTSGKTPGLDGLPAEKETLAALRTGGWSPCCVQIIRFWPKRWPPASALSWSPSLGLSRATACQTEPSKTTCFCCVTYLQPVNSGLDVGLISLDQEKAFDRVDRTYLFQTLEAFGFGPFFIGALRVLYQDTSSLLKVNGVLCAPFPIHRGIHQGCPLSGMLYALAIEPLQHALRDEGDIKGIRVGDSEHKFLLYADDALIFLSQPERSVPAHLSLINNISNQSSYKNQTKSDSVQLYTKNTNTHICLVSHFPFEELLQGKVKNMWVHYVTFTHSQMLWIHL
uniref:Reverse transcriptase domain-containing protein n=1 Tax=Crocodylus porosus TaxID=8502 RepID=A0A7M4G3I8_CROPO